MTMRCKNGQEHTHETVAQSRVCWLGGQATTDHVATLHQPVASAGVDKLSNMVPVAKVADGRYAVTLSGEDKIRFFHVRAGRHVTFVDEQAGDSTWPVKPGARRATILATIAADPNALARYGQKLGVCGKCGRTLTDETSRAVGMGLICRGK